MPRLIQSIKKMIFNALGAARLWKVLYPVYWMLKVFYHAFKEVMRGNFLRAAYLIILRLKTFVEQGFQVDRYLDWIVPNEPLPFEKATRQAEMQAFAAKPLISIVTPVFHPPASVLTKMLDSVAQQTYPNWEHCLVNADPADLETCKLLQERASRDPRIKFKMLDANLGIARNTNMAIQMAQGEWVAFLDHDDELAPFALFEVVKVINQSPAVDVLFSDEDKLNAEDGQRFSPFFKPDLNLDYLRALNYLTHFLVVRKTLGDRLSWLDAAYDGSQDYDLALRLVESTPRIQHIAKILYHWKTVQGSTAETTSNKSFAVDAGERALSAHLARSGEDAQVLPGVFPYQVRYTIPGQPKISIIIPNRDSYSVLKRLLDSIFEKSTYANYEIILVENGSTQAEIFDYYTALQARPNVKVITWSEPFHYSLVNNFGVEHSSGDVVLLLNNDMEVITPDWLERMLEHAMRPAIGAVGAKLLYPNNTIQHAGVIVGMFGAAGHSQKLYPSDSPGYFNRLICPQNYSAVTAACLMMRRGVYDEVRGLDPAFQVEFGDVDLCLRILARGYRNLWTPFSVLYHYESLTRGASYDTPEKVQLNKHEVALFKTRWASFIEHGDPAYSPNLTIRAEDFNYRM